MQIKSGRKLTCRIWMTISRQSTPMAQNSKFQDDHVVENKRVRLSLRAKKDKPVAENPPSDIAGTVRSASFETQLAPKSERSSDNR